MVWSRKIIAAGMTALLGCYAMGVQAALPAETPSLTQIKEPVSAHQSYILDFNFNSLVAGKVVVIDADEQKLLGMVPTGFGVRAEISHDRKWLYTADIYYSRGTRGERTMVLTAWSTSKLTPEWEVEVPDKVATILTERYAVNVSDDDRFVYIWNFTPASSVTVVDTKKHSVVSEVDISGCVLNYPAGNRKFFSICGNGDLQGVTLDDQGKEIKRTHTTFFDPNKMKMVERAQRGAGDMYYFTNTDGDIYPVDFSSATPKLLPTWSLLSSAEKKAGWRPGGWQLLAVAPALDRIYVLMHKDADEAHWEDPSDVIWAFDLKTHKKVATIKAQGLIWSMVATTDDKPLLLGVDVMGGMETFDLATNKSIGVMKDLASTPTLVLGY